MRYIGNIVTESNFKNNDLFFVTNNFSACDKTLPTLIIGLDKVKSLFPDFSIIDWKISDNIYWTFGFREKRTRYETDIDAFKKICMHNIETKVRYSFKNVLTLSNDEKVNLFNMLKSMDKKVIFMDGDMLYIYLDNDKNEVFGLSVRDIEYEGGDKEKLLKLLKSIDSVIIFHGKENISYSIYNLFSKDKYIIPFLYY